MSDASWRPTSDNTVLRARANLVARIRQFFADLNVLEVDTPLLGYAPVTDPHIECFAVPMNGPQHRLLYLQSSPEYAMKRLLAAGITDIYQLCKAFRVGEDGRQHLVEFSMLEWYRQGFDHHTLMAEVEALFDLVLKPKLRKKRVSYADLFTTTLGVDPDSTSRRVLGEIAMERCGVAPDVAKLASRSDLLDILFSFDVQPNLDGLWFVFDYPACQSALARVGRTTRVVAHRFEVFLNGIEMANGYFELGDVNQQRQRMRADLSERKRLGLPQVPPDESLLAALDAGIGDVAGVAVGLDRLIAASLGLDDLRDVLTFVPGVQR